MPFEFRFAERPRRRFRGLLQLLARSLARGAGHLARESWKDSPLTYEPTADKSTFLVLYEEARAREYPEVRRYELDTAAAIDREFLDHLALHTQVVAKQSALNWAHGRVLYSALRAYLRRTPALNGNKRITILETGTARAFSTLCMARALADAGRAGTILTIDIVPHEHRIYWNCIDDAEGKKTRRELLEPWQGLTTEFVVFLWGESRAMLPSISADRIHFAFIDAGHDYETVMFEFNHVAPRQKQGDVIVFDDVTPICFPGIVRAVKEICSTHGYDRIDIASSDQRQYVVATKC